MWWFVVERMIWYTRREENSCDYQPEVIYIAKILCYYCHCFVAYAPATIAAIAYNLVEDFSYGRH